MSDRGEVPPEEEPPEGIEEPEEYAAAEAAAWAALVALLGAAAAAVIVDGLVNLALWPVDAWDPAAILAVAGRVYAREFAQLRPDENGEGGRRFPLSEDDAERYALRWVAERENLLAGADDAVFRQVQSKVEQALVEGMPERELAAYLRGILNPDTTAVDWRSHARRIARTEVHSAEQAGQDALIDALVRSGSLAAPRFAWLNAGDARVRPLPRPVGPFDHHDVADATWPAAFQVSGEALKFPGDPAGSPGNVINCRCTKIRTGQSTSGLTWGRVSRKGGAAHSDARPRPRSLLHRRRAFRSFSQNATTSSYCV